MEARSARKQNIHYQWLCQVLPSKPPFLLVKHQGHLKREEYFEKILQLWVGSNAAHPSIGQLFSSFRL